MRIQCNACEAAEARVLCCPDESALCWGCDARVHAANKLAGKHQRYPLLYGDLCGDSSSSYSRVPNCDICQEASGYFFCLEDRALLCRNCDVAIHTANPCVSVHRRFLLTGVQVGIEPIEPIGTITNLQVNAAGRAKESPSNSVPQNKSMSLSAETNEALSGQVGKDSKMPPSGFTTTGSVPDWPLDELFVFPDFGRSFAFNEHDSSKADSGKLGSTDVSELQFSPDEEELNSEKCLGQVPESSWTVPETPSPPTASGLHWQRNRNYYSFENAPFVPDICSSTRPLHYSPTSFHSKRKRMD